MERGITIELDKNKHKIGIKEEKGHVSIILIFKKSEDNNFNCSISSSGIEGDHLKEWIHKVIELHTSIKIRFTKLKNIDNPISSQKFVESRNELLISQYNLLKEKLKKKGLLDN
jgi:hypothetical protein